MDMTPQAYPLWIADQTEEGEVIGGLVVGWVPGNPQGGPWGLTCPVVAWATRRGIVVDVAALRSDEAPRGISTESRDAAVTLLADHLHRERGTVVPSV